MVQKIESWHLATLRSKGKATWKESDRHAKKWKCRKAERGASTVHYSSEQDETVTSPGLASCLTIVAKYSVPSLQ